LAAIETFIDITLFVMLVVTALAVVRIHSLFAVVMLSGVFSLLSALLLVTLDAVDVAFTEAAVGAGISTVLMLSTLALTTRQERHSTRSPAIPLFVVVVVGAALFYGTLDMPNFGAADAPAMLHVYPEYMERSPHEIGVPNVVTGILASYRGYDTLGETAVVFTAGIGVLMLLSTLKRRRRDTEESPGEKVQVSAAAMAHHLILRVVTKLLVGAIILFALYVQFHGDYSPGGGFQAGVIMAVAFIIYGIVFSLEKVQQVLPPWLVHKLVALGVLIYAGTGVYSLLTGYNYLDYTAFSPHYPEYGQHIGILLVELGVGVTVTGVMVAIYYAFAARTPIIGDEEW
jgi:multicomponent Na+:H+ antiporter subunit B